MKIIQSTDPNSLFEFFFFCPGCQEHHGFRTASYPEPPNIKSKDKKLFQNKWRWNNDFENPTITPSIHIQKHRSDGHTQTVCHSMVQQGTIQYLSDCKHDLSNKCYELPDLETV